jgi:hypothetical protein
VWPPIYLRSESAGLGRIRPPKLQRSLALRLRLSQGLEGRKEELAVVGSMGLTLELARVLVRKPPASYSLSLFLFLFLSYYFSVFFLSLILFLLVVLPPASEMKR